MEYYAISEHQEGTLGQKQQGVQRQVVLVYCTSQTRSSLKICMVGTQLQNAVCQKKTNRTLFGDCSR